MCPGLGIAAWIVFFDVMTGYSSLRSYNIGCYYVTDFTTHIASKDCKVLIPLLKERKKKEEIIVFNSNVGNSMLCVVCDGSDTHTLVGWGV